MVRVVPLQGTIEFADPEAVFSFLYADEQFYERYHKEVNNDPNVEVTNWTEDGIREVHFKAPLEAPKLVRTIIGADTVNVKERQRYKRDGDCFTITSEAYFDIPGGDHFLTSGKITLCPDGKQGCIITVIASLEFKTTVWGVQGTVENFMESQTKASFEKLLEIARSFCEERIGLTEKTMLEEDQDEYFDADALSDNDSLTSFGEMEQGLENSGAILNNFMSSRGRNKEDTLESQSWIMQRVLTELSILQLSSNASHSYLEKMNAKLLKVEEDLRFVRSHITKPAGIISKENPWCLYGLGIVTGLTVAFIFLKQRKQS